MGAFAVYGRNHDFSDVQTDRAVGNAPPTAAAKECSPVFREGPEFVRNAIAHTLGFPCSGIVAAGFSGIERRHTVIPASETSTALFALRLSLIRNIETIAGWTKIGAGPA